VSVAKDWDELSVGVKGFSNLEIAGILRNILKYRAKFFKIKTKL